MGEQPMPMQQPSDPRLVQALAEGGGGQDEVLEMVKRARRAEQYKDAFGVWPDEAMTEENMGKMIAHSVQAPQAAALAALPATKFPKLAGALAGTVAGLWPGEATPQGKHDPAIEQLQREMKATGDFPGKIDGIDGPETQAARQRFEARKVQEGQRQLRLREQELEAARIKALESGNAAESARATAELEKARAAQQEYRSAAGGR
jgi:hypothetical protein